AVRGGEIVGHAMYATVAGDAGVADLAVVVADAWPRRGLGRRLVRGLLDTAQAHGVREVRFTVLAGNPGAHRLVAGFAPRRPQATPAKSGCGTRPKSRALPRGMLPG